MHAADVEGEDRSARVVHVVVKTHCDLGFTDLASKVVEAYTADFFPRALSVADELRRRGGPERLVWTTGSLVLHWALTTGDDAQRARVADGVRRGDLAWHALPATTHTELLDAELVRSGLRIGAELDAWARNGVPTIAAKMTDVPGHTRSLVPLLAEAGVRFLHLGVNPAWPVPDVPPVFRWRSPDGSEVVVAYQSGGYGGTVRVPGLPEVLTFLHANDNQGPPTVDEVLAEHAALRARFPEAEVRASTLDDFARAVVDSAAVEALPVVTSEIGDPWLFGAGSDPMKVSAYRDLLRSRDVWRSRLEADGEASYRPSWSDRTAALEPASHPLVVADRSLYLVAEHTWGLDQKTWLPDTTNWSRSGLAELRRTDACRHFESSWTEQREYVDKAADALGQSWRTSLHAVGGPGAAMDLMRMDERSAMVVDPPLDEQGHPVGGDHGFRLIEPGQVVEGGPWQMVVDPVDGSLRSLVEQDVDRIVGDSGHRLGLLRYQSFDAADYERFYAGLRPAEADEWWARWDNTKPGIESVPEARSGIWSPVEATTWHATTRDGAWHDLRIRVRFADELSSTLGAPPTAWIRWFWTTEVEPRGHSDIEATLWWADKPANRLPEALWFSFDPVVAEPERWSMEKLGQQVSPLDVVRRGGRALHAIGDGGLSYEGPDGSLRLRTVDAPLVAPGRPRLLDADPPLPDMSGGWHVLLGNNCWGTNFPMWIEGAAGFRFDLAT